MKFFGTHVHYVTLTLLWNLIIRVLATPNIGIQQDWFTESNNDDLVSYSGLITFNANADGSNPVDKLSDGQLVGLVDKAYSEMNAKPGRDKPGLMALLAHQNAVYFASSIRNDRGNWLGSYLEPDKQRPQILVKAAGGARLSGSSHRIGGTCGEINIMDLFFTQNRHLNFKDSGARFIAYGSSQGSQPQIFNPCNGNQGRYGCWDMMRSIANPEDPGEIMKPENIKLMPKNTAKDNSWPDDVEFVYRNPRLSTGDKEAICQVLDDPFDPNDPI